MSNLSRTLRHLEHSGHDQYEDLHRQIRALRKQVAALSAKASAEGHNAFDELTHEAADLLEEALHQGGVVAKEVSRHAISAGRAVQRDPMPVLVAIGTLALISSIVMRRR